MQRAAEPCKLAADGLVRVSQDSRSSKGPFQDLVAWALGVRWARARIETKRGIGRNRRDSHRGGTRESAKRRRASAERVRANSERERPSAGEENLPRVFADAEKCKGSKGGSGHQGERQRDSESPKGWPWDEQIRRDRGDPETARGRARAERMSAQSRAAAGGSRAAVVLLILCGFPLSEALSVTLAQRQFIILQRGPAARCDPAA